MLIELLIKEDDNECSSYTYFGCKVKQYLKLEQIITTNKNML